MKSRQALGLAQVALALLLIAGLVVSVHTRARNTTLAVLDQYHADWPVTRRAPVEHLAVEVLGQEIAHPERDFAITQAALSVLRRSPSWAVMAPDIGSQLKGWLDVLLRSGSGSTVDPDQLRDAFQLLVLADADEVDSYQARIAALAGDRSEAAATLLQDAHAVEAALAANPGAPSGLDVQTRLAQLVTSWRNLRAPHDGRRVNWLTLKQPVILAAERAATDACVSCLCAVVENYLYQGNTLASYGESRPDKSMLTWLDHEGHKNEHDHPEWTQAVMRAQSALTEFAPDTHLAPLVEAASTAALRRYQLPWAGLIIGLLVTGVLTGGLWFAMTRLARGPRPVDVDAETMENVEPIDLDTDAETRSRSSASLTDIG